MKRTLWRAANDTTCMDTVSLASDRASAEAYRSNPGFGGRSLYAATVEIDASEVLDLRTEEGLAALCTTLGIDRDALDDVAAGQPGELAHRDPSTLAALVAAGYRWTVHTDSYPAECETWTALGWEASSEVEDALVEVED